MPKLTDVAKQLDAAAKELAKEQRDWKVQKGTLQRDKIKLTAVIKKLESQVNGLTFNVEELTGDIDTLKLRKDRLKEKNDQLEVENHKLDKAAEAARSELTAVENELAEKKRNLDSELEEYVDTHKREIKAEILKANSELTLVRTELQARNSELQSKKVELGELNQVYLDEQDALKISNAETEKLITANKEKISSLRVTLTELEEEVKSLEYRKNQANLELAKIKEEHDKFVEYEAKARKILNTKDRQLQEKAAEITSESQFLKNQRSFLAEL